MQLTQSDIKQLDRKYRINLINSLTGIKPANLIGTKSQDGRDNVAIFSSVVHLGSNPALLGMVTRPQDDGIKDTYANIIETKVYTINHVTQSFIKKAHYTSAKLPREESEFDTMGLQRVYIDDFHAPFVSESPVKIGMKYIQDLKLPNGCLFIIGEIVLVDLPDDCINPLGQIDLAVHDGVGIAGLNTYYSLSKKATFPYVRRDEIPSFDEEV